MMQEFEKKKPFQTTNNNFCGGVVLAVHKGF